MQECKNTRMEGRTRQSISAFVYSCILMFFVSSLSGCYDAPDKLKPMPWIFNQMPKDAPNNYKRGWKDGCESGLGNMTNAMYKTFYTFKQDAKLREDSTYYTSWKTSYNFCRHYAYGTLRESNQRFNLSGVPNEFYSSFMGADGGMFSNSSALHLWGPADWLLPLQKIGPIGGDDSLPGPNGNALAGQSEMDFSDGYYDLGMGDDTVGSNMSWDYSNVPFFGSTNAWGNK